MPRIKKPLIILMLGMCWALPGQAEIYKWVDADGKTHYSEKKPAENVKLDTIKLAPRVDSESASQALEQKQKAYQERQDSRSKKQQTAQQEAAEHAEAKANCEKAKARVASMQRPRVNVVDGQGNRVRIGEEERQKQLSEANKAVKQHCK